jgi:hypothetical protein
VFVEEVLQSAELPLELIAGIRRGQRVWPFYSEVVKLLSAAHGGV